VKPGGWSGGGGARATGGSYVSVYVQIHARGFLVPVGNCSK
jgi:hypothetical protein